jgi:hypothetical protein
MRGAAGILLPAEVRIFSMSSRPALGLTQLPIQWTHGEHPQGIKWLVLEANLTSIKCRGPEMSLLHDA